MKSDALYPLELAARPVEKVWGGQKLSQMFGYEHLAGRSIGEVWTAWDEMPVENGPYQGATLAELVRRRPLALLGSCPRQAEPPMFPLLAKFLDARELLSVQVHPDAQYASRYEGQAWGKAEMWYILDSEPGAYLIHGVRHRLSRAEAEEALQAGTLQEALEVVGVTAGDVVFNPPGTIHALGPGIVLFELQQASDLTYRLYDWQREQPGRPLHVQKALDVARLEPYSTHKIASVSVREAGAIRTFLCTCETFAAELLCVDQSVLERPAGRQFHLLTGLSGYGKVKTPSSPGDFLLRPGKSLLVPACVDRYRVQAEGGTVRFIKSYVPAPRPALAIMRGEASGSGTDVVLSA